MLKEFPGGVAVKGSNIVTAVAQVTAVVQVQSLGWELLHALSTAKKKKKKRKEKKILRWGDYPRLLDYPVGPKYNQLCSYKRKQGRLRQAHTHQKEGSARMEERKICGC